MSISHNLQGDLVERGLFDATAVVTCLIFTHDSHESLLSQPQKKS